MPPYPRHLSCTHQSSWTGGMEESEISYSPPLHTHPWCNSCKPPGPNPFKRFTEHRQWELGAWSPPLPNSLEEDERGLGDSGRLGGVASSECVRECCKGLRDDRSVYKARPAWEAIGAEVFAERTQIGRPWWKRKWGHLTSKIWPQSQLCCLQSVISSL